MTTESLLGEARVSAEATCGEGARYKAVTDRRGCAVWHVVGPAGSAALKVGSGPEGTVVVAREVAVLELMGSGRLLNSGHAGGQVWMLTPWYDGPSTWEALEPMRRQAGDRQQARKHLVELCGAVAGLHAVGWVHGDLQPGHTIHTPRGLALIDCSWAYSARLPPSTMFRGGMPHLLAPELALSVERGELPVCASPTAEVYTLAASMWWAITGHWPLDYAAVGVDTSALKASELRQVIGSGRVPLHPATVWPSAQEILATVLDSRPEERPSAAQLAALLRSAA